MSAVRVIFWLNASFAASAAVLCLADPDPILFGAMVVAGSAALVLHLSERWGLE